MQNNITVILGRKGSGKTTLSKYLSKDEERLIIWDFLGQFETGIEVKHTATLEKALKHSAFQVSIRLPEHYFPFICQFVKQAGKCKFLIDEIDMISSPTSIPRELDYLIRYGRHHEIDILATARRPAEVHRNLTANADDIYVYQTHEPRDLTYLDRFMDTEKIMELERYQYLHYNALSQEYTKGKIELE